MYAPFDLLFVAMQRKNAKGLLLCSAGEIHPGRYRLFHSSESTSRWITASTSRIIVRSCGTEYSELDGIASRFCDHTMNWWRVPVKGPSKPS